MMIAIDNSIKFVLDNYLDPNPDNTLLCDQVYKNIENKGYNQKYVVTKKNSSGVIIDNPITVQIRQTLTETVTFTLVGSAAVVTPTEYIYDDFKTVNYEFLPLLGEIINITASSDETDGYVSEPIEIVERENMLKIQWFKYDNYTVSQFDYTHGEVNEIYIEGWLREYVPSSETTVYDNLNEQVTTWGRTYRGYLLQSTGIPVYLSEKIEVSRQFDRFVINDIAYNSKESVSNNPLAVLVEIELAVIQTVVLGDNSDDTGYNCDVIPENMERVQPKGIEDAAGSGTFTVTEGYGIFGIFLTPKAGASTPKIKIGSTPGGEEILREFSVDNSAPIEPASINTVKTPTTSGAWTIYYDVTVGIMDIYIVTIMLNTTP